MDPNFSFQINLVGVTAAGGGKSLEEGYYAGTVVDCYSAQNSNGSSRLVFKIGNFEGYGNAVRTTSITFPNQNTKEGLRSVWRAALESAGYTDAQLNSGMITMTRDTFLNRPAHIYYKPGDRDAGIYDEIKILSPKAWTQQKASFEASSGSALGAASPAPAAPVAQAQPLGAPQAAFGGGLQAAAPAPAAMPTNGVPQGQTPAALRSILGLPAN
jgi:hypothetical protein